jgi:hypothetical protein
MIPDENISRAWESSDGRIALYAPATAGDISPWIIALPTVGFFFEDHPRGEDWYPMDSDAPKLPPKPTVLLCYTTAEAGGITRWRSFQQDLGHWHAIGGLHTSSYEVAYHPDNDPETIKILFGENACECGP